METSYLYEEEDHPIFDEDRFYLNTLKIKSLKETILSWIWTGAMGGMIIGYSRTGKSTAIDGLCDQIIWRNGKQIPCVCFRMGDRDVKNITTIFRGLCFKRNLRTKTRLNTDEFANNIIINLAELCHEARSKRIIIFVDEMQFLRPRQFNAFAEIHAGLKDLKVLASVIFIGNDPDCIQLYKQITDTERYRHIFGRFFTRKTRFEGITSREEVEHCLTQYDTLQYPENGPTYTQYFLDDAKRKKWRLASISLDVWSEYNDYVKGANITSWGMQYFTATVRVLLCDTLREHGIDAYDPLMIKNALNMSGVLSSSVSTIEL